MENIKPEFSNLFQLRDPIQVPQDTEDVRDHEELTSGDGFIRQLESQAHKDASWLEKCEERKHFKEES